MGTEQLLGGLLVTLLTQVAKKVSFIPVNEGQTKRLRILAGVLSVLVVLLNDYLSGSLVDSTALQVIADSAVNYGVSFLTYKSLISK